MWCFTARQLNRGKLVRRAYRRIVACLALILFVTPGIAQGGERPATTAEIMSGLALNVREQLGRDFQATLANHATTRVQARFDNLSRELWSAYPPQTGWSFFASLSIPLVARPDERNPVIAYYHPFSDVFFLTLWEIEDERVQILNLEILPGSRVRNLGTITIDPNPLWLATDAHPVAALAEAIQLSANAFWQLTRAGSNDWRALFSTNDNTVSDRQLDHYIVEHNLGMNVANLDNFWFAETTESRAVAALREAVTTRMAAVFEQGFGPLLAEASESEPYAQTILENVPVSVFADMEVVYYLQGRSEALVFLASTGEAHLALCLTLHEKHGEWEAVSVDVIPYALMLQATSAPPMAPAATSGAETSGAETSGPATSGPATSGPETSRRVQ